MKESAKMASLAVRALENKKGEDLSIIDISEISVLADYFIIASGRNRNQVQAMSDNVEEMLAKEGWLPKNIEGYHSAAWVLLDYRDIVIHIFSETEREFYDLERIWRDGQKITADRLAELAEEE